MDDKETYLLNGLLTRHFGVGRIVRFRKVERGRQAETYEIFTAQEQEYLVQLYPAAYAAQQLNFMAGVVNMLDGQRFSVVPFVASKVGTYAAEGPQQTRMLVSLAPVGSALSAEQYSEHDISQVGLRLAWMHRLLKEQLAAPGNTTGEETLAEKVMRVIAARGPGEHPLESVGPLISQLKMPTVQGWAHGDVQLGGLLHDSDHQLRTVTDWGLLHHGSPLEDLVDAFCQLSSSKDGTIDMVRGKALLGAYSTLMPIKRMPWTPVVASWCAQRLIDDHEGRRPVPEGFYGSYLQKPEQLVTALASCI